VTDTGSFSSLRIDLGRGETLGGRGGGMVWRRGGYEGGGSILIRKEKVGRTCLRYEKTTGPIQEGEDEKKE